MPFVRFVLRNSDAESGVESGPFRLAYALRDSTEVAESDRAELSGVLAWFGEQLNTPSRFNTTRSKGFYRRNTRGIAWFKDTAREHLARMHRLKTILERYGHVVTMVSETKIGYVVYEDDIQVVAEPFSDTRTG